MIDSKKILKHILLYNSKRKLVILAAFTMFLLFVLGCGPQPPIIQSLGIPDTVQPGSEHVLTATVFDPDSQQVQITWELTGNVEGGGSLNRNTGQRVVWTAPSRPADVFLTITAIDEDGAEDEISKDIFVRNEKPFINSFTASSDIVLIGNKITLTCQAEDPENTDLTYSFDVIPGGSGEFTTDSDLDHEISWRAPADRLETGYYNMVATVKDAAGYSTSDTLQVLVYSDYGSIWVVDSGTKKLKRFTSNGELIVESEQEFVYPVALANNYKVDCASWVADYSDGKIYKIGPKGETLVEISDVPQIIELKMHKELRQLMALSRGQQSITVIDCYSNSVVKTIKGFNKPRFIDVNQSNADVWVSEPTNNRIVKFNIKNLPDSIYTGNSKVEFFNEGLHNPRSLTVGFADPTRVYIADKNDDQIEQLIGPNWNRENTNILSATNLQPDILESSSTQYIWIIGDRDIYYFNENDLTITPHPSTFLSPETMDIDHDGDVWIGDNGKKQLLKIDTDRIVFSIEGFQQIEDIIVNK
ncbi:MAG TPA: hypothetical protein VKP78_02955 [bacterium]|nr:hypothetical protein [bacterium]